MHKFNTNGEFILYNKIQIELNSCPCDKRYSYIIQSWLRESCLFTRNNALYTFEPNWLFKSEKFLVPAQLLWKVVIDLQYQLVTDRCLMNKYCKECL